MLRSGSANRLICSYYRREWCRKGDFPQIIHQNSQRKHGQYIAVNCGAIPEGTIDSELSGTRKVLYRGVSRP